MDPGDRAPHRRVLQAQDGDVQRVRRSGGEHVLETRSQEELLKITRFVVKPLVFLASLAPAIYLTWAAYSGRLSADPLSDYRNETGAWALRFICITLLLTPLRRVTKLNLVSPFRRMMGLFAFFYGSLHFVTYVVLDRYAGLVDYSGGYFSAATMRNLAKTMADDVVIRPYITGGVSVFVLMDRLSIKTPI